MFRYYILLIVVYLVYVWVYICPTANETLTPINYHLCQTLTPLIQPVKIFKLDEKINWGIDHVTKFDESRGISSGIADMIQGVIDQFQTHVVPRLVHVFKLIMLRLEYGGAWTRLQFHSVITPIWTYLKTIKGINQIVQVITEYFQLLLHSKHAIKVHEKSKFLQSEYQNLKSEFRNYFKEDVETIVITSTVEVTDYSLETEPAIYEEIRKWEVKIDNVIDLAVQNIKNDMETKCESVINKIKPEISSHFQYLQQINHEQYKLMNLKIKQINKDYERMLNGERIETVSRQEIRDDIKASSASGENCSTLVQGTLIRSHEVITKEYFTIVQDTIDILESYVDTTMNELLKFINEQEDVEKWNLLTKFHKLKNKLFNFRDSLYNNANEYKSDNKKKSDVIGLDQWNEYLNNVEFHLNYLLRDNTEYLRLIRAQANVAFQLREELNNV